MDQLETRELTYFVAVAEELHFSRAAERLGIAQPPLSRAISRLERRIGVRLLERTSRQVKLTAAGSVFFDECRRLLQSLDAAVHRTRRADRSSRFVLAVRPGTGSGLLAEALRAYESAEANTLRAYASAEANTLRAYASAEANTLRAYKAAEAESLRTHEAAEAESLRAHEGAGPELVFTADGVGALRDGTADVALLCTDRDDLTDLRAVDIAEAYPVALVPNDHPLAGRVTVTVAELRRDPAYREQCPPAGLDEILDRVALGRLVTIVGSTGAERLTREVAAVPVTDVPSTTLALAWLPRSTRPEIVAFAEAARRVTAGRPVAEPIR